MYRFFCYVAGAFLILPVVGCNHRQVRMRLSPRSNEHEWRDLISQEEFLEPCRKLQYTVKPTSGYLNWRRQPHESFTLSAQINWNEAIDALCARFDELCHRHNSGLITIAQFEKRKARLMAAVRALDLPREHLDSALAAYITARETLDAIRLGQAEGDTAQVQGELDDMRREARGIIERAAKHIELLSEKQGAQKPPTRPKTQGSGPGRVASERASSGPRPTPSL